MTTSSVQVKIELGHRASIRKKPSPEGFTHDWSVFVRGPEGCSIQNYVDKVVFFLHETFPKPKRSVKEPPFQVSESGYAGFNMHIEIHFKNREEPRLLSFNYDMFLHEEGFPPVCHIRCEKLTFQNPTEDFRRRLLKAGGVGIPGHGDHSKQPSATTETQEAVAPQATKSSPTPAPPALPPPPPPPPPPPQPTIDKTFTDLFGAPLMKADVKKHKVTPPKDKTASKPKSSSNTPTSSGKGVRPGTPTKTSSKKENQSSSSSQERSKDKDKPLKRSAQSPPVTDLNKKKRKESSSDSRKDRDKDKSEPSKDKSESSKDKSESSKDKDRVKDKSESTSSSKSRDKDKEKERDKSKSHSSKNKEKEKDKSRESKSKSSHRSSRKEDEKSRTDGNERGLSDVKSSERGSSDTKTSERVSSDAKNSERGSSDAKNNERGSSDAKSNERVSSDAKSSERGSSNTKSVDRVSLDAKSKEQGSSDTKSSEQCSSDAKSSEQGSSDAKSSERISSDAKISDSKLDPKPPFLPENGTPHSSSKGVTKSVARTADKVTATKQAAQALLDSDSSDSDVEITMEDPSGSSSNSSLSPSSEHAPLDGTNLSSLWADVEEQAVLSPLPKNSPTTGRWPHLSPQPSPRHKSHSPQQQSPDATKSQKPNKDAHKPRVKKKNKDNDAMPKLKSDCLDDTKENEDDSKGWSGDKREAEMSNWSEIDLNGQKAPNGEDLTVLLELQRRLMSITDRCLLQSVVGVIQQTDRYKLGSATLDFDLCVLDGPTVQRLRKCLEAKM